MAIVQYRTVFARLSVEALAAWREVPAAIATDVLNRGFSMSGDIAPIKPGLRMVGQARTLGSMVADSSGVHVLCDLAEPGDVLVMDMGDYVGRASWGGNATRVAMMKGAAGVVLNGAVRDAAEIRELGFPVFCRAAVPGGPHKGHGGNIDLPVAVGGVVVSPGDIIIGDDDGITVVPLSMASEALLAAQALIAKESDWVAEIEKGRSMANILNLKPDKVV